MTSIELFVGAGGLAHGVHLAGFNHAAVLDWNKDAIETLKLNKRADWLRDTDIIRADISSVDFMSFGLDVDLLAGGPPCQPFSVGGRHNGHLDPRDMFPQFIRAMRELRPRAILVENVQGLTRQVFADYFTYILLRMSMPERTTNTDVDWMDHLVELRSQGPQLDQGELSYVLSHKVLNAADYGVPQQRRRVFIVGFRSDLNLTWSFPEPTHSSDALAWDKWVTGGYWQRHGKPAPQPPDKHVATRLVNRLLSPVTKPWLTVRDVIADLPDPRSSEAAGIPNHVFQDGAKVYPGHTGSPLDEPAKTLKAGVHGVPGGENMVVLDGGTVRYFTAREAARIQTFSDEYLLSGAWSEMMRQLGNAVPVRLGEVLASSIKRRLKLSTTEDLAA